ncbi:MAG: hypothetical protein TEF_10415 [Rhizobiales bacterium NRL2]|jgi:membrane protein|nr:MAG: hypothetical protein TEF_10415 [Rhizobiales bacterium NRL2]
MALDARRGPGREDNIASPAGFGRDDWSSILSRVKDRIGQDNLSLIAAGVAFFAMLALFPAIAALVGFYGFFADPADVEPLLAMAGNFLPETVLSVLEEQVRSLTRGEGAAVGLAAILSLGVAIWSARAGVLALVTGLGVIYRENGRRGLLREILVSLTLTALLIVVGVVALAAVVLTPVVLNLFNFGAVGEWLAAILRWPIALGALFAALAILYRHGPCRRKARLIWVAWGVVAAVVLWAVGSALFSVYVANFASYNETYGSIGAVIALLMWLYVSAFVVLLGALLSAEMEHQTQADTTIGHPRPVGERGAYMADNVPQG